jgi:hypothetical protein
MQGRIPRSRSPWKDALSCRLRYQRVRRAMVVVRHALSDYLIIRSSGGYAGASFLEGGVTPSSWGGQSMAEPCGPSSGPGYRVGIIRLTPQSSIFSALQGQGKEEKRQAAYGRRAGAGEAGVLSLVLGGARSAGKANTERVSCRPSIGAGGTATGQCLCDICWGCIRLHPKFVKHITAGGASPSGGTMPKT